MVFDAYSFFSGLFTSTIDINCGEYAPEIERAFGLKLISYNELRKGISNYLMSR